jgi:hypothetical protein
VHAVFKVVTAIPEIGANPGDTRYAESDAPDAPLVLIRKLPAGAAFVLDDRVTLVSFSAEEPSQIPEQHPAPVAREGRGRQPLRAAPWRRSDSPIRLVS